MLNCRCDALKNWSKDNNNININQSLLRHDGALALICDQARPGTTGVEELLPQMQKPHLDLFTKVSINIFKVMLIKNNVDTFNIDSYEQN